jgi:phosphoglycolate phosphatase
VTFTVGFDLDMTLIDGRIPIAELLDELAAEEGADISGRAIASKLGPPLEKQLLDEGMPAELVDGFATRFRARYPSTVVSKTLALPGAAEAIDAVRAAGGSVVVVSGKATANARLHLDEFGWPVDALVGDLFSDGKAAALREHGASAYVGDHTGDMIGAKTAGVLAVGVLTGPCGRDELGDAGADVVLDSLTDFPRWFSAWRSGGAGRPSR